MAVLTVLPDGRQFSVPAGTGLLNALRQAGFYPDAPCGGLGKCGKCRVSVNCAEVLACQTVVETDMTVLLPASHGPDFPASAGKPGTGALLAFDIGTTTVVCYLLSEAGEILTTASALNPQTAFGADVVSRIRAALAGEGSALTAAIRRCMEALVRSVCEASSTDPAAIRRVAVVGNSCMQQLFLGLPVENLARPPFDPLLRQAKTVACGPALPCCPAAELLLVPDIAGFLGADILGCVLAENLQEAEELTLLLDIGTNGEMVLGSRKGLLACATAAGPALEGAGIHFGMRGTAGAIDRVWAENGDLHFHVIGGGEPKGLCGSGLIDAVAVFLEAGQINRRGRVKSDLRLTEQIFLSQEDIRQVQLAKGAIRAGIELLAEQMGVKMEEIQRVFLAGAFGSALNPASACRIGLIPEELLEKITSVGNAAGAGAIRLARDESALALAQTLAERIRPIELSSLPGFPRRFAKSMEFREAKS